MTFRELAALRKAKGYTLRTFAAELGIDFTYLSKIETGANRAGAELARRIDAALNANGAVVRLLRPLSVGTAWKEAETACPAGSFLAGVCAQERQSADRRWYSWVYGDLFVEAWGHTPAGALDALTEKLRTVGATPSVDPSGTP